jgi:hypothetical protein
MARFLMESEPVEILATGSCQIDQAIAVLPDAEAYDTANIIMRFANGKEATIDVCRQAPYGYDQRCALKPVPFSAPRRHSPPLTPTRAHRARDALARVHAPTPRPPTCHHAHDTCHHSHDA